MVYVSIMYPILITTLWNLKSIWHTSLAVELGCQVKLPCLEWCLIASSDDTLELILQRLVAQLILAHFAIEGGLLHIRIAECCGHGPAA